VSLRAALVLVQVIPRLEITSSAYVGSDAHYSKFFFAVAIAYTQYGEVSGVLLN
jgi:hypothetical protein